MACHFSNLWWCLDFCLDFVLDENILTPSSNKTTIRRMFLDLMMLVDKLNDGIFIAVQLPEEFI
jgi:hypothetical protein